MYALCGFHDANNHAQPRTSTNFALKYGLVRQATYNPTHTPSLRPSPQPTLSVQPTHESERMTLAPTLSSRRRLEAGTKGEGGGEGNYPNHDDHHDGEGEDNDGDGVYSNALKFVRVKPYTTLP